MLTNKCTIHFSSLIQIKFVYPVFIYVGSLNPFSTSPSCRSELPTFLLIPQDWSLQFPWYPSWMGYSSWWRMYLSLSWCIPIYHVALYNRSHICLFAVFILLGDCVCKTCYRRFHVPHIDMKRTCACGDSKVEGVCRMCYLHSDVLHPSGGGFAYGHNKQNIAYWVLLHLHH